MKILSVVVGFLIGTTSNLSQATGCDTSRTARQMVKSIIAIEDIKGIVAIYGGVAAGTSEFTVITIEPHYQNSTKDSYKVKVRNNDCRILEVKLGNSP